MSVLERALRERSLMTSHTRVGRGSKIVPKEGRYRVGQGKKRGTSLINVPFLECALFESAFLECALLEI